MSILVIPAVSAGNIPQLAIDLLIHTLGAKRVDILDDKYLYPVAGPQDYVDATPTTTDGPLPGITTAVEVYQTQDSHDGSNPVTFIQIRSPPLAGMKLRFVLDTLVSFVNSHSFSDILVAGSSNAGMIEHHRMPPNRFKLYTDNELLSQRLAALSIQPTSTTTATSPGTASKTEPEINLPESGIVLDVLRNSSKFNVKSVSALVMFAYEGDNFPDARAMANELTKGIGIDSPSTWRTPKSWTGVYGRTLPTSMEDGLYG